jgi:glycerol-3-phosphate acyltransferase PlsX
VNASTIAIDALGGDHGVSVTVPAALSAIRQNPDLRLILVGDRELLKNALATCQSEESDRLSIHHASQKVEMNESPALALRNKKDSSMRVAINLVKEGVAQACVSAGNTGALMATARFVLKTLPGIDRPAISAMLPTAKNESVRMLDLGANVDSSADNIFQFAVMGSILASVVDGVENPKVGLLNIGTEDIKGNELVKSVSQRLSKTPEINYIGYVEGDDIFKGNVNVVVCDGFVGNVALKVAEGATRLTLAYIKKSFQQNVMTRMLGAFVKLILKRLKSKIDPANYNGASLVGLQGIVIKSHGGAEQKAFENAIFEAAAEIKNDIPKLIRERVEELLERS